ncbi:hypothetical protein O9929_18270 [Vibrio lentus]|nr:hypothetical protein [Vibrio lentus]
MRLTTTAPKQLQQWTYLHQASGEIIGGAQREKRLSILDERMITMGIDLGT